ncbi:MAG: sodium:solute symporter family protein [Arenicellales bacterium]
MNHTSVLSTLDWSIIVSVLLLTLVISLLIKDKNGKGGVEEFFVANRNAKWWFLGTSIVATTFASDTPLVITGWVAKYGIAGNWLWWGGAIGVILITVFFARTWRSSGVVTDAEIAELRYGGKPATVLRSSKAFVFSVVVNCVILGWVFAGMGKIAEPFMDWQFLLGDSFYTALEHYYPSALIFNDLNTSLTIFSLVLLTLIYSTIGGLKAILVTDFIWFILAISMAVVLCIYAVSAVGGLGEMWSRLGDIYPSGGVAASLDGEVFLSHEQLTSFIPTFSDGSASIGIPFSAFFLTLTFMWWTNGNVDGAGFFAQRLYTAENNHEAEKGSLWYAIAHFIFRSWPWILAGLAALVLYPRGDVNDTAQKFNACLQDQAMCTTEIQSCLDNRYTCNIKEFSLLHKVDVPALAINGIEKTDKTISVFREDRERGYPALIKDVLPSGLMGLALVALMGAFMSTVSTHINWGASYLVNDFYLRFFNPKASNRQLTFVSRLSTLLITLLAIIVASTIENIGTMWLLNLGMMAGLGLPHLMRWFWWRANAWTELAGMLTGVTLAIANYVVETNGSLPDGQMSIFPSFMASHPIHVICWISMISALISIVITFLTPAVDDKSLQRFVDKVKPIGFWKQLNNNYTAERSFAKSMLYLFLGCIGIYAGIFGIGYLVKLQLMTGGLLVVLSIIAFGWMIKGMADTKTASEPL